VPVPAYRHAELHLYGRNPDRQADAGDLADAGDTRREIDEVPPPLEREIGLQAVGRRKKAQLKSARGPAVVHHHLPAVFTRDVCQEIEIVLAVLLADDALTAIRIVECDRDLR